MGDEGRALSGGNGALYSSIEATTQIFIASTDAEYSGRVLTFFLGHTVFQVYEGDNSRPYTVLSPDPHLWALVQIWPVRRRAVSWPTPYFKRVSFRQLGHHAPRPKQ